MEEQSIDRWLEQLKTKPAHAYFLAGDKSITQKFVEQACAILFCENDEPPCHQCQSCQWFEADTHPDFHHIQSDTTRVRPVIRIETVRALQEVLYQQPQKKYRVVWIEDMHTMRHEGQNALLKVLEEPPKNLIFILTGQIGGILPTVYSRCRVIRLGQENQQLIHVEDIQMAGNILLALFNNQTRQAQKQLADQKQQMVDVIDTMVLLLREVMAYNCEGITLNEKLRAWVEVQTLKWPIWAVNDLLKDCLEVKKRLQSNANSGLCADWLCIRTQKRLI